MLQELNNRRIQSGRQQITADLVGEGQAAEILHHFFERGLEGMADNVRDFIVDCLLTSSALATALPKKTRSPSTASQPR